MDWEYKTDFKHRVDCGEGCYYRGGGILKHIFTKPKDIPLSGENCMTIFNTYGFTPELVVVLCYSHGYSIDKQRFSELLYEQKNKMKGVKPLMNHLAKNVSGND